MKHRTRRTPLCAPDGLGRDPGRFRRALAVVTSLAAFTSIQGLLPERAEAQLSWGLHAAKANETGGGAWGGGAQLQLEAVALPVGVILAGEYFDVSCDDCSLLGWSLDAKLGLVFPVLDPYVTAGLVNRKFDPGPDVEGKWRSSIALGGGVGVPVASYQIFAELRYEFVDEDQMVWRFGIRF